MLILGLILILGSAALTTGLVYDGGESASVEVLGATVDTTIAGVFFTGAATMLVFLVGVWMLTSSMGRARRKRGERKQIRQRHRDSVARLEEERTQLRAENERLSERLGQDDTAETGTTAATGTTGPTGPMDTTETSGASESPRSDADLRRPEGSPRA